MPAEWKTLLARGRALFRRGDYAESCEVLLRALAVCPPSSLRSAHDLRFHLADALHELGDLAKGLQYAQEALALRRSALGPNHKDTSLAQALLGSLQHRAGASSEALLTLESARDALAGGGETNLPLVAIVEGYIGEVHRDSGDPVRSLEAHRRMYDIQRRVLGESHVRDAYVHDDIGEVFLSQGRYAEALNEFEAAQELRSTLLDAGHTLQGESVHNIGRAKLAMGDGASACLSLRNAADLVAPESLRAGAILLDLADAVDSVRGQRQEDRDRGPRHDTNELGEEASTISSSLALRVKALRILEARLGINDRRTQLIRERCVAQGFMLEPPAPPSSALPRSFRSIDKTSDVWNVRHLLPSDRTDSSSPVLPGRIYTLVSDVYDPSIVEADWDMFWEAGRFFEPLQKAGDNQNRPAYALCTGYGVTGQLHLGHAITALVQDTLVRWRRMEGDDTVYVNGADHAGMATSIAAERRLMKEQGKTRHDLGRERYIQFCRAHVAPLMQAQEEQLRLLGASHDWKRFTWTLSLDYERATVEAFVRLFDKGLIQRESRIINWCCTLKTAISDVEVEYVNVPPLGTLKVPGYDEPVQFGTLWNIKFAIEGSNESLIVSTATPEGLFAVTAVALHSDDERLLYLQNHRVLVPLCEDRSPVPVIVDDELVKPGLGTGAVMIAPGHSVVDAECASRHGLASINMLDASGNLAVGCFKGKPRFAVRQLVINKLNDMGAMEGTNAHAQRVGLSHRSHDVVEQILAPQWFLDISDMAKQACELVRSGDLRILPKRYEKTWFRWLENEQPWCLSRQGWWGTRIPVYFCNLVAHDGQDKALGWVAAREKHEARQKAVAHFDLDDQQLCHLQLQQDDDVLDTWFNSSLWSAATHGWPNTSHPDFKRFFPNEVLETGHDILFFWVAREVMVNIGLGLGLPFRDIYLHNLVRDRDGRKMSKSLGNVLDPRDLIAGASLAKLHSKIPDWLDEHEIETARSEQMRSYPKGVPPCGADATRFGLLEYVKDGREIKLDVRTVLDARRLASKIWQVARFVLYRCLGEGNPPPSPPAHWPLQLPLECCWMLLQVRQATFDMRAAMQVYNFRAAICTLRHLWVEVISKTFLDLTKRADEAAGSMGSWPLRIPSMPSALRYTAFFAVDAALRLTHPFMPFVTEELWQRLWFESGKNDAGIKTVTLAPYAADELSVDTIGCVADAEWVAAASDFELLRTVAKAIRNVAAGMPREVKAQLKCVCMCTSEKILRLVDGGAGIIARLAHVPHVTVTSDAETASVPPGGVLKLVNIEVRVYVWSPSSSVAEATIRLKKEQALLKREIAKLQALVDSRDFQKNAVAQVVEDRQNSLAFKKELMQLIEDELSSNVKHQA